MSSLTGILHYTIILVQLHDITIRSKQSFCVEYNVSINDTFYDWQCIWHYLAYKKNILDEKTEEMVLIP